MWRYSFLHDRLWILPWIKSISNKLDIIIHVITSQLYGHCDVISNQMWLHQQSVNRTSKTRGRCVQIAILSSFMDSLCHVRNKMMFVLSWQTVYVLTWVLFWCLFPSLLRNSGNKHQNNPVLSAFKRFATQVHSLLYIYMYPSNYAHMLCCDLVPGSFTHVLQDEFTGTGEIIWCQWNGPEEYRQIDHKNP